MSSRASAAACCLALAASLTAVKATALEFPMPAPGEDVVGEVKVHTAVYEDTFAELAKGTDLGYLEMVAANPGVDAWLPGAGTQVILPTRFILPPGPREGVVINLAEYRLYYYSPKGDKVYTYPLGIGREGWSSPVSQTRITAKTPNPAWYPPESIRAEHAANGDPLPKVVAPGPDNPLGPFKFTLGIPGYLIHGSNRKFGIGMRVSHGCFRMLNNNVLELAKLVPVGTPVRIINQPYKFGVSDGQLYLEAHEPLDDHGEPSKEDRHAAVVNALLQDDELVGRSQQLDWDAVRAIVDAEDGLPVRIGDSTALVSSTHNGESN